MGRAATRGPSGPPSRSVGLAPRRGAAGSGPFALDCSASNRDEAPMKPVTVAPAVLCASVLAATLLYGTLRAQSATDLQAIVAPAHGLWVDSLDLSKASI